MIEHIIFSIVVLLAFGIFAWTVQRYVRVMLLGEPDIHFDRPGQRILDFFKYFLFQRKVAQLPSKGYPHVKNSLHHLLIFWGFLIITAETVEMIITGVSGLGHPYLYILGSTLYNWFRILVDVTNFVVFFVIVYAFLRRIFIKPRLIPLNFDAALILGMIAALNLTYHTMEAYTIQAERQELISAQRSVAAATTEKNANGTALAQVGRHAPISDWLSYELPTIKPATARMVAHVNWWVHLLIVLFFLNYLPFSKHIHLLGAWANILFRRHGPKGVMPKIDLEGEDDDEDEEPAWGVEHYEQFTWKELLDTYSCTECARCSNHCPANLTGKPLSPMDLVHQIRYEMLDRGKLLLELKAAADEEAKEEIQKQLEDLKPLVAPGAHEDSKLAYIADETLWSCTTCGACREVCPVFIEHPNDILRMRTNLVLAQEGRVPAELANAFQGLERNGNPWGLGADSRFDWAEGLDIPVMGELDDPESVEYLFFIGCAGNYDMRSQKQAKAAVDVLKAAGVSFAVLGPEESCCGDSARRAGNEYLFQMLAEQNIETFNEYKVKKIVTGCPHGYHTFLKEYPQFGGNFEVIHLSQLITDLMHQGRLKVDNKVGTKMTLHDSCYLGRWNDIYDEPREVARSVAGNGGFIELPRHGSRSFCCGAGGGRFWMEEDSPRINEDRAKEIVESGADVVAVACPFCTTMITDGLKAFDKEDDIKVLDLAELVAMSLHGDKDDKAAESKESETAEEKAEQSEESSQASSEESDGKSEKSDTHSEESDGKSEESETQSEGSDTKSDEA